MFILIGFKVAIMFSDNRIGYVNRLESSCEIKSKCYLYLNNATSRDAYVEITHCNANQFKIDFAPAIYFSTYPIDFTCRY